MKSTQIFNVNIDILTKEEFLEELKNSNKVLKIAKINTEFLQRAVSSKEFTKTLDDFDINVADGIGVLWVAKYLSLPLLAKRLRITNFKLLITIEAIWQMIYSGASLVFYPQYCRNPLPHAFRGADMMFLILDFAEKEGLPVYLFGASEKTLEKAVENIKNNFQNILVAGYRHGYDFKDEEVIKEINSSSAKILFVALGSPQQEYWIRDNISKLDSVKIAVGEGGSFEFIAGTFRRAPRWMKVIGLEWLWRLFANKNKTTDAGSRFERVWNAVPVFIYRAVKFKTSLVIPRNKKSHRKYPLQTK